VELLSCPLSNFPQYNEIRHYLNEACANKWENLSVYTTHVLAKYVSVFLILRK
jgi:hypothetical protein